MLDIHLGSISLVCTPACNMLLNLMVMGKGNFTIKVRQYVSPQVSSRHTDNITAEEGVDPAHDEGIGNDHGHVVLHHAHHAIHGAGIGQRVRRRLSLAVGLLQVRPRLEAGGQDITTSLKGLLGEDVVVGAQGDAAGEGPLLTHGLVVLLLGRGRHEDGYVVAEDTGQDHDDGDGDKDPVAGSLRSAIGAKRKLRSCAYNSWGSL